MSTIAEAASTGRKPDGLHGLAEYEALVRASSAPAILMIDRELMLRLLDYVHRLEAEARREGGFW